MVYASLAPTQNFHHILRLLAFASQSPSPQPQNVSYLERYATVARGVLIHKNCLFSSSRDLITELETAIEAFFV